VWVAQLLSVYYLAHRVQRASELYGSLGTAAAILAWLYVVARLMVASAMLNAALWERRTRGATPER
jgi:membrane protein